MENSSRDSSSRCPSIGFQRRQKESTETFSFSASFLSPFPFLSQSISPNFSPFYSFFPYISFPASSLSRSSWPTVLYSPQSAISYPSLSRSLLDPFYRYDTWMLVDAYPARSQERSALVGNERLLTVGKNYLNWNWSFSIGSRRLHGGYFATAAPRYSLHALSILLSSVVPFDPPLKASNV